MLLAVKANLEVVIDPSEVSQYETGGYRIIDTEKDTKSAKKGAGKVSEPIKEEEGE